MRMICNVCNCEILAADNFVTCISCKLDYHCSCVNTNGNKLGNKCDSCCNVTRRLRVTDDTPIKSRGSYTGTAETDIIPNIRENMSSLSSSNISNNMENIMELFTKVITDKIKTLETNLLQELKTSVTVLVQENNGLKQELCETKQKCIDYQEQIKVLETEMENYRTMKNPGIPRKQNIKKITTSTASKIPSSVSSVAIDTVNHSPQDTAPVTKVSTAAEAELARPSQLIEPSPPRVSYAAVASEATNLADKQDNIETTLWTEVKSYRKKNLIKKGGNTTTTGILKAVERKKYLHVWRLDKSTTELSLREYIQTILDKDSEIIVKKITPRTEREYASFKIGITESNYEKLSNPAVWPLNVEFSEWIFLFRRSDKTSHHEQQAKVILYFSIIYLVGTVLTCCAAIPPLMLPPTSTSMLGLFLIATGTGGIKPCVAAFGGDQFRLPEENHLLQRFFSTFYCTVNLGGFMGMVVTPAMRRSVMCFGDDACYALGFGFPALLVLVSIIIFVAGKPSYRIKQPQDNITYKFISCTWYAFRKRMKHDPRTDNKNYEHWLDHAVDIYGEKLISDMKVVFSILYMYLPVPIFWSLFDQQGSRWTFQASRLRSEVFGITLMPDQLQVMNPAMVLLMIPVCPGGSWPLLPELAPLQKMFIGGMLASLAFVSAGILQLGIERSTLQIPRHNQTGLVIMNTLSCPIDLSVKGEGIVSVDEHSTALMTPLPHRVFPLKINCPVDCAGRLLKTHVIRQELKTVAGMFMPVVVGQNSDDELAVYFMDPNPFSKSLTGKPKLKVVYLGNTGPNKNVSILVETDKRLSDIYYVSDAPVDHIGESAHMCLQPGKFKWRAQSADGEVSGSGEGYVRPGGVYVLCIRERLGRLDAAVLHAPNPPNEINLAWIVPQYLLISIAEIMFAVSGLEFSFTEAPKSMKTITIAAWYVSVAFGNLIVILVAQAKLFESRANEFFVYAAMLAIAMLLFLRMAQDFRSRNIDTDGSSSESRPLLHRRSKVISIHSLSTPSTRTFSGDHSAASCLGLMERARAKAWPTRAFVHIGTPSTGNKNATTLAHQ